EEVTDYAELIPVAISGYRDEKQHPDEDGNPPTETSNANPSSEELFEKLQNYKKLLDNGLILQAEYDALKKEILGLM
ncbi:MAG TPA: SHOCT domain-containing protein, partial [Flavobacterium sp.]|nr:SHOCT domain-containing protein [Flavobacterium sp.]